MAKSFQGSIDDLITGKSSGVSASKKSKYTQNDLVQDQYYSTVESYMASRYGVDDLRDKDREEVVDMYLNNMRGFSGGNSVRAISEVSWLNGLKDEEKRKAGEAYALFEGMANVFSSDATWAETGDAVLDYTRSALLDPVNIASLGVGSLAAKGSSKAGAKVAAQKLASAKLKTELAKGVTREVAEKAATKVYTATIASSLASQRLSAEANRAAMGRLFTSAAMKEIAATTAFDTLVNVGVDYAYQNSLMRTGVQEEYSFAQAGLAALGSILMGGANAAYIKLRGSSDLALPDIDMTMNNTATANKSAAAMSEALLEITNSKAWKDKVANGKELTDLDSQFWVELLLGNPDKGIEGFTTKLSNAGFGLEDGDKRTISDWMTDILYQADPEYMESFIKTWEDASGIKLSEASGLSVEDLFDTMARKISDSAKMMNAASQASKVLKKKVDDVTLIDMTKAYLDDVEAEAVQASFGKKVHDALPEGMQMISDALDKGQSNIIRLIVSHPGTTRLNLVGWGASTATNTISDVTKALILGGKGALQYTLKTGDNGVEASRVAKQLVKTSWNKVRTLADPDLTQEAFLSYVRQRPTAMRDVMSVLPGGVETTAKSAAKGFDPSKTVVGDAADAYVDFAQTITLTKYQDILTKSQEFTNQLDKKLRLTYDKGWSEFFNSPDAAKLMGTDQFKKIEAEATYETLRAIYSKSYRGDDALGRIAGWLEDFRSVPGLGLMMPFGRFMNNTVAFMFDGTGLSMAGKLFKGYHAERTYGDLALRAALSWGAVSAMALKEEENIDRGLAWDEYENLEGGIDSYKFDFPFAPYKAASRLKAYFNRGEEPPTEFLQEIGSLFFGQSTRQLTSSGQEGLALLQAMMQGDLEGFMRHSSQVATAIPSSVISGATRWMDPINQVVGAARGDDYAPVDRRQGSELVNKSLRYIDQIIESVKAGPTEPKWSATRGVVPTDPGKGLGGQRETTTHTYLQKGFNMIGMPDWRESSYSKVPEADNRYNELFFKIAEPMAKELVLSDKFRSPNKGNASQQEVRKFLWTEMLKDARERTIRALETGDDLDEVSLKQIQIGEAHSWSEIDKALAEIAEDLNQDSLEFETLTLDQLEMLENYLSFKDRFIRKQSQ